MPKLTTFRGKESFFEITLKKSFFAQISENNKIQGKCTFVKISLKKLSTFQHFEEKKIFFNKNGLALFQN